MAQVAEGHARSIGEIDEELTPSPTVREKRWVKVGWPSKPQGDLWLAEYDTAMYGIEEEENLVPEDAGRLLLARDMG